MDGVQLAATLYCLFRVIICTNYIDHYVCTSYVAIAESFLLGLIIILSNYARHMHIYLYM